MANYESQVGKCQHCQADNNYQYGLCLKELLDWGYPYACNGRGEYCPDFKKMEE